MPKINTDETIIDGDPNLSNAEKRVIIAALKAGFEAFCIDRNTLFGVGTFLTVNKYTHYYDRTQNRLVKSNIFK